MKLLDFSSVAVSFYLSLQQCMLFNLLVVFDCFATPGIAACQAPQSVAFPRQGNWSALAFPSAGIFLTQGSTRISCVTGRFFTSEPLGEMYESFSFSTFLTTVVFVCIVDQYFQFHSSGGEVVFHCGFNLHFLSN